MDCPGCGSENTFVVNDTDPDFCMCEDCGEVFDVTDFEEVDHA